MPTFANLDYRNCSNCSFVRSITGGTCSLQIKPDFALMWQNGRFHPVSLKYSIKLLFLVAILRFSLYFCTVYVPKASARGGDDTTYWKSGT